MRRAPRLDTMRARAAQSNAPAIERPRGAALTRTSAVSIIPRLAAKEKAIVYHLIVAGIQRALGEFIRRRYALEMDVPVSRPPKISLGEAATPLCFELARRLKRPPREIAAEIAAELPAIAGVARWEVAGGGYLNAFFDRAAFFARMLERAGREGVSAAAAAPKVIVEHTCINPNKAAHVGHLRNAALGDTFARTLRHAGQRVEVQNYIDNTGVQVADVVLGFLHLEKKSAEDVRALAAQPRFDYTCWNLYARVSQFLAEYQQGAALRAETLKNVEHGLGAEAQIGEIVADAIVHCHLRTMERIGVEYDLLPRESEILRLKFWDAAFAMLKEHRAIEFVESGKNAGCWVMPLGGDEGEKEEDEEGDAKILVRSNGTVTYVGKDIAYHLWKFGLLGRDFHYAPFDRHPSGHVVWVTQAAGGEADAPEFGRGEQLYNVIDARQAYVQNVVHEGLRALGYAEQSERHNHFAYEIVALTPRCAAELGYDIPLEDAKKPYIEVSGRKGLGVKADDLLDRVEANALAEVVSRHPDEAPAEQRRMAHRIAVGAVRYYLLKYTRTTPIAFDFKDALSFEGETGPYCQYAVVRARNILRKWREKALQAVTELAKSYAGLGVEIPSVNPEQAERILAAPQGNDFWELLVLAGSSGAAVESALGAQEPAFIAKHAFQLAQAFNNFYHRHHILSEEDEAKQAFLLLLSRIVEKQLVQALGLLGIEAPEKM
jgi:arginyl-tRNA synthetase